MVWATAGQVGARPAAVARPTVDRAGLGAARDVRPGPASRSRPPAGAAAWSAARSPCTAASCSTSAACPASSSVDPISLVVEVLAGTFGDRFEAELPPRHGLTVGHWPQSMALSTVGGWLACRGAGQLSTRYGKIEDIVVGLEVVLADGRVIRTGGQPRQAVGPDLNQLFVGSEGTLGVITRAWLRAHPAPAHERRAAYGFADVRRGPRRHAPHHPAGRDAGGAAPLRRGRVDSATTRPTDGVNVLLVLDEGDGAMVDAGMEVVAEECEDAPAARRRRWSTTGSSTATTSPRSRR